MVKTTFQALVWVAVILALLVALVGVSPTEAGEFVRGLWSGLLEFLRTAFGGGAPATG